MPFTLFFRFAKLQILREHWITGFPNFQPIKINTTTRLRSIVIRQNQWLSSAPKKFSRLICKTAETAYVLLDKRPIQVHFCGSIALKVMKSAFFPLNCRTTVYLT